MKFTVIVDGPAEQDWLDAVTWYEEQKPGLSQQLNVEIFNCLSALSVNPKRFRFFGRQMRKAKIPDWPFSVFFTINTIHREVKVIAIWHGSRNPSILRRRLP